MAVAQSLTLILYAIKVICCRSRDSDSDLFKKFTPTTQTLDEGLDSLRSQHKKKINLFTLAIPAFFDIVENALKNVSLTLITPSILQMCRSSVVVFTAFLAVCFLRKRLYRHHWSSIGAIVLGIALCGYATMT